MTYHRMLLANLLLLCLAIGFATADDAKITQDNWVLDNLNSSSFEINGSKLTVNNKENNQKFNALYQGIVANEKNKRYYWEFTCIKNCHSVGVAKKDKYFNDGHSIKGAFFHYNLHDNGELLVSGFGDGLKDGDRVGYILDLGEQDLKIYIVQNDRPLGLAFFQKAPYASEIYPAVVISGSGSVEIREKNTSVDNLLVRSDYAEKGIKGDYKLIKVTVNGTDEDISGYNIRLDKANETGDKLRFSLRVGNILYGLIVKNGQGAEGDLWSTKENSMTAMAIFGKTGEDEETILDAIYKLKQIKFSEQFDEFTIISAPDTVLQFKRFLPEKIAHMTDSLLN